MFWRFLCWYQILISSTGLCWSHSSCLFLSLLKFTFLCLCKGQEEKVDYLQLLQIISKHVRFFQYPSIFPKRASCCWSSASKFPWTLKTSFTYIIKALKILLTSVIFKPRLQLSQGSDEGNFDQGDHFDQPMTTVDSKTTSFVDRTCHLCQPIPPPFFHPLSKIVTS